MYAESAETNVTSVVLMSACNHMGFVHEGMHFFVCIALGYRIPATVDHYALAWLIVSRLSWQCQWGKWSDQEDVLWAMCFSMDGLAWCLQNSWLCGVGRRNCERSICFKPMQCLQAISYQSHIILLVCGISMHISTTGMVCMKNQSHLDWNIYL